MGLILGAGGRSGVILPTGIATDDTTKYFFGDLVERRKLVSLYSFENEEFVFPAVHHAFRFCLLTVAGSGLSSPADLVFYARQVAELSEQERHFSLTPDEFMLLNPNSRTSPTFRSRADAEIAKSLYRRVPVLVDESQGVAGNPWAVSFMAMFHMANDSGLFLEESHDDAVPLYEAKLIHQFTHRWATYEGAEVRELEAAELDRPDFAVEPRYWVHGSEVESRLGGRTARSWLLAFRDVTGAEKVRTAIAAAIPRVAVGHTAPLVISSSLYLPFLLANLNSYALDWSARLKVGGLHLTFGILEQLPLLTPADYDNVPKWAGVTLAEWLRPYVVELVCTADDVGSFGEELGWAGRPFRWTPERRRALRADLDAAYFHCYGLSRADVIHVMESFWVVRDRDEKEFGSFRTRDLILDAYDAMEAATLDRPFVSRLDPPPGDPRAAHPPRPGGDPLRWVPWSEVLARAPQVAPAARPTRNVTAPPAKPMPAVQLRAVQEPASTLFSTDPESLWQSEATVAPSEILMGARVRHRAKGEGTILSIRPSGKSMELLIRFDTAGEAWIVFGYGVLEFSTPQDRMTK